MHEGDGDRGILADELHGVDLVDDLLVQEDGGDVAGLGEANDGIGSVIFESDAEA